MPEDEVEHLSAKELREGRYLLIDGVPCRVLQIEISSPGKHGSAKMRITGIGIFDGHKKVIIMPNHSDVEVPILKKKKAQIVSVTGANVQLMDSDTYEVYELPITEEFVGKLVAGNEVEVIEAMGRRALSRLLGGGGV
jgi:translation initiation factor 5A